MMKISTNTQSMGQRYSTDTIKRIIQCINYTWDNIYGKLCHGDYSTIVDS